MAAVLIKFLMLMKQDCSGGNISIIFLCENKITDPGYKLQRIVLCTTVRNLGLSKKKITTALHVISRSNPKAGMSGTLFQDWHFSLFQKRRNIYWKTISHSTQCCPSITQCIFVSPLQLHTTTVSHCKHLY
jgi:hypothetical protein